MRAAPIAIVGAGGLGRELLVLIQQINQHIPTWQVIGFYDDDSRLEGTSINGFRWLGTTDLLSQVAIPTAVVIAIGNPLPKQHVYQKLKSNAALSFPILVHPQINLQPFQDIQLKEGTVITAGCQLTVNIKLGKFVLLNLNCTVGHDAVIGDYCSLMPGVHVSGEATIGKSAYLGTGSVVLNKVKIGENAVLGAGAVAVHNIPSGATAVGIPARSLTTP